MTTVLAILAFAMAFGAIWFTSEVLKRVDTRNDAMVKPHFHRISESVEENNETLKSLIKRLARLEKQVRIVMLNAELPQEITRETASLKSGLNDLQCFTPTIRLDG